MAENIVMYCKDCGNMFFACCENPVSMDTAKDIAKYLTKGHKLASAETWVVKAKFGEAGCRTCDKSIREAEQKKLF